MLIFKFRWVCLLLVFAMREPVFAQDVLPRAFAHNDYQHKRPLLDALDYGVTNIEADIFLRHDKLVVAHYLPLFRGKYTLEEMYFKPLAERYTRQKCIYSGYQNPILLMIDIKSDANKTYKVLRELLLKYQTILTACDGGVVTKRAITVVISGHKPHNLLKQEKLRLAFIDDDLRYPMGDSTTNDLFVLSSTKYSHVLSWNGKKDMPAEQEKKLCTMINDAHKNGRLVRLWAIPQNPVVWNKLMDCGVDLINSDNFDRMKAYFNKREAEKKAVVNLIE